jgi:acyl carrier protein
MTIDEIKARVHTILVEGFEIEPGLLKPEAHLADDLGLDSLDGVDLVVAIEKRFGCRVDESEARAMRTLQDIYDAVARHAQESPC